MEVTKEIMQVPELLKEGIDIYATLKDDMKRALGLRRYAQHLSYITQILKEVHTLLDKKEEAIADTLQEAYDLSQKGMDKATVLVTVLKEQSKSLSQVLSESGPNGTDQDKIWTACAYFAGFSKAIERNVVEAEDALREASNKLFKSQNEIASVVTTLKRVQEEMLKRSKAAKGDKRAAKNRGAAVRFDIGPISLLISRTPLAKIENEFELQRKQISEYIEGFIKMHHETKDLEKRLHEKRTQLLEVQGKLVATTTALTAVGADVLQQISLLHFAYIRRQLDDLVKSCETFLACQHYYGASVSLDE